MKIWGTRMHILIILALLVFATSCSTPYQANGLMGGFSATQLDNNVFQVSFRGNGYTNNQRAEDFALLRSAEIAISNGYEYFTIVDAKFYRETHSFTTPSSTTTQLNARTFGTATGYGNTATYSGTTFGTATTTTYGGQTYVVSRPTASNTVILFKERPQGFAYNAPIIVKSLREKYGIEARNEPPVSTQPGDQPIPVVVANADTPIISQPQLTIEKDHRLAENLGALKPLTPETKPTTKTHASLVQYDGPKIKSGVTLDAEFVDDGSGSGDGVVTYPGGRYFLRGKWSTLSPGKVEAPKLIDKRALNALRLAADVPMTTARFTDGETILECLHGETLLGQRKGECQDNYGNKYHLVFKP